MSGLAHVKLHLQKHYNLTYMNHKIFFFQVFQPFANLNTTSHTKTRRGPWAWVCQPITQDGDLVRTDLLERPEEKDMFWFGSRRDAHHFQVGSLEAITWLHHILFCLTPSSVPAPEPGSQGENLWSRTSVDLQWTWNLIVKQTFVDTSHQGLGIALLLQILELVLTHTYLTEHITLY